MRFWLYKLDGDKRYIDKSTMLTPLYNTGEINEYFEGAILDETSVLEPTFKFSRHKYWKRCNYLFCEDTLRYYYVTDVTMAKGYVYVKCHVDVLNTFKDALRDRIVIAKRSESKNNSYLNDDKFKAYAMPKQTFFMFNHAGGSRYFSMNNQQFILTLVGHSENENEGGE